MYWFNAWYVSYHVIWITWNSRACSYISFFIIYLNASIIMLVLVIVEKIDCVEISLGMIANMKRERMYQLVWLTLPVASKLCSLEHMYTFFLSLRTLCNARNLIWMPPSDKSVHHVLVFFQFIFPTSEAFLCFTVIHRWHKSNIPKVFARNYTEYFISEEIYLWLCIWYHLYMKYS